MDYRWKVDRETTEDKDLASSGVVVSHIIDLLEEHPLAIRPIRVVARFVFLLGDEATLIDGTLRLYRVHEFSVRDIFEKAISVPGLSSHLVEVLSRSRDQGVLGGESIALDLVFHWFAVGKWRRKRIAVFCKKQDFQKQLLEDLFETRRMMDSYEMFGGQ